MGKKKKEEIKTSELSAIIDWRESGLSFTDIAFLVKKKFKKDITSAGIKYLLDKWQGSPIK